MEQPIEKHIESAHHDAREIVNAWCRQKLFSPQSPISPESEDLFEKARLFEASTREAANHRENGMLIAEEAAEEIETRRAFAEAYRRMDDKHRR